MELWEVLKKEGFNFFTGIPDSTFKPWMSFLQVMHQEALTNIVACNECEAIAIASGYHLSTDKIGVVYLQNSGFGKAINPLTSLSDSEVYSIPILLMIGWRGEPGIKDEPQHQKMGRVMLPLLDVLEIPHKILPVEFDDAINVIKEAKEYMLKKSAPFALIIKKNTFDRYRAKNPRNFNYELTREESIKIILESLKGNEIIISTTGKTSRELFEARITRTEEPRDFYTVGSMGCSPSIALGFSLNSNSKIIVFDGDGALIMQMGALATIGHYKPTNFYHILFDNHVHDSTGGQPTVSDSVDFKILCMANGYNFAKIIKTKKDLQENLNPFLSQKGPAMLIIKVKKGSRKNLGRPTTTPIENKLSFVNYHKSCSSSK